MQTLLNAIRAWKLPVFCTLSIMTLASCSNSTPIVRAITLVYECSGSFPDKNNDGEFISKMGGTIDYDDNSNRRQTAVIKFQTAKDILDICVTDEAGLDPKKSYNLTLVHEDANGVPVEPKSKWTLVAENLSDAVKPEICFKIAPGNGNLSIEPGTPIGGTWRILQTDREIQVNYHVLITSKISNRNTSAPKCSG